jgi:hypothetical protein
VFVGAEIAVEAVIWAATTTMVAISLRFQHRDFLANTN